MPGPFATVELQRGAMRLVAVSGDALALGIAPGQMLADARALVPDLATLPPDLAADATLLEAIARRCGRYGPLVALDPPDGVLIDISGVEHLFGGEMALADDAVGCVGGLGLSVRHAIAGTPEAARALARFQTTPAADEAGAVRRLPIAALGLEDEAMVALRRAGLRTIGDLAARPTAPLAARFGAAAVDALARLLGTVDSRLTPWRPPPAILATRRFAEPVTRHEDVMATIGDLVEEVAAELAARGEGGRRFAVRLYRSDGAERSIAVDTSLPVRDAAMVMRLFDERLDALVDPIDPGFGFDLIRLAVPVSEALGSSQLALDDEARADGVADAGPQRTAAIAALVDRLATRHGRARVRRLVARDAHLPEQGVLALPALDAMPVAMPWSVAEAGEPPLRPIHLFDPPQPIQVMAEVPDGPPQRFRWQRRLHEVMRYEGPERIADPWWDKPEPAPTRDYYRIEDARGRRLWVFRHGLYGSERANPTWYVHGLFA